MSSGHGYGSRFAVARDKSVYSGPTYRFNLACNRRVLSFLLLLLEEFALLTISWYRNHLANCVGTAWTDLFVGIPDESLRGATSQQ